MNRSLQIVLLYNAPALPPDHRDYASEAGVLESVASLKSALVRAGHKAIDVAAADSLAAMTKRLDQLRPDVIVNLCESWRGESAYEPHVAALLEMLGLAYTGSPPGCVALVRDKASTKRLLSGAGIATAEFVEIPADESLPDDPLRQWLAEGPVFVKPAREDASLGIGYESVATDWAALREQVAQTHQKYGPALAERYIAGRELNVGIIELPELTVLPLAEIEFRTGPNAAWPILTYDSKWSADSHDDRATPVRCPAQLETDLARQIEKIAMAAFRLTGCRDYGRVDLRVDSQGEAFVLEVNANPDIGPHAGFARMLAAGNVSYDDFARRLVEQAQHRGDAKGVGRLRSTAQLNALTAPKIAADPTYSTVAIRALRSDDIPLLLEFTRSCGFFRPDEVDVAAELLNEALRDGPSGHYQVLVAEHQRRPAGWSCHGRVPLTDATFDLYWIVVAPQSQRAGIGRQMLSAIEATLAGAQAHWLLAETSSTTQYSSTREFYLRCGFAVLSQIDDFYRPGDGRVIFGKRIDRAKITNS